MKSDAFPQDCIFITYNKYMEPEIQIHPGGYHEAKSYQRLHPNRALTIITKEEFESDGITLKR